jgi:hypothetical protein
MKMLDYNTTMPTQPVFAGLVFDEFDRPVEVAFVGEEAMYVVDDNGFRRHIPSEQVDRQVLDIMRHSISGHEDMLTEQAAKMLGQDDIFSRAMIEQQIKNIENQFDQLIKQSIPEDMRAYLGMMGFRIRINVHGEVIEVEQPGMIADEGDE